MSIAEEKKSTKYKTTKIDVGDSSGGAIALFGIVFIIFKLVL